ncbi:MAG: nucleoside phosphorylase, partial [Nitrososphaeria archaeon]
MPLHIKADSKNIANKAIVSGNIEIVKQLSELLHGKLVNENRGFLIYSGSYMGVPVSAVYHGVGGSSQSIVLEELVQLGTKRIIELNYAIKNYAGDFSAVISNSASYTNNGVIGEYVLPQKFVLSAVPSFELIIR